MRLKQIGITWLIIAVTVLTILYLVCPGSFSRNLETLNSVLTFVLAPLALVSAWVTYAQWKLQRDREEGYEDLHLRKGKSSIEAEPIERPSSSAPTSLTLFKTSKQTTTLNRTKSGIQCHIKDIRPGRGGNQWFMPNEEVAQVLTKKSGVTAREYKEKTGLITIGKRENWLYTKSLFAEDSVVSKVRELLEATTSPK